MASDTDTDTNTIVAGLILSGSPITVVRQNNGDIGIQTADNRVPIYMTTKEAELLIAALVVAMDQENE